MTIKLLRLSGTRGNEKLIVSEKGKMSASSFELLDSEVKELNDEKIISLARIQQLSNDNANVRVYNPEIQEKPGKYFIYFSLLRGKDEIDHVVVEARIKRKSSYLLIRLSILLLFLLVLPILLYLFTMDDTNETSKATLNQQLTQPVKKKDEELSKYSKDIPNNTVTLGLPSEIRIEEEGKKAVLNIHNPSNNIVGQSFILKDSESGQMIFETDIVEPGEKIELIDIDTNFPLGERKGEVVVIFHEGLEKKVIGGKKSSVTIKVDK